MARSTKPGVVGTRPRAAADLIAVDGASGGAVARTASRLASARGRPRVGVSSWDASGLFGELEATDSDLERPSDRTLMLLFAADLAFRLRWEIGPALAQGRGVIAAPYVDTGMALGRALGLNEPWLQSLFEFAPLPTAKHRVDGAPVVKTGHGPVESACRLLGGLASRGGRVEFVRRVQTRLKSTPSRRAPIETQRTKWRYL